jgi:hypothetical protein
VREEVEPGILGQVEGYLRGVFDSNGVDEQGGAVEELVLEGEGVGVVWVVHPMFSLVTCRSFCVTLH